MRKRRWLRRLIGCAAILAAIPLLACLAFIAAVHLLPYPRQLDQKRPAGVWIADRRGTPLAAMVAPDDQWHIPLEEGDISEHLLNAIVAVEDASFHSHSGVNWKSVAAATWQNLTALRVKRGASTITMQVYRLRQPGPRSFGFKIEQAVRAAQIEKQLTKRQILVEYFNRAPFGGNLVGAGAASWRYFGRPCRNLSLGQAALLAGVPQSPTRFRPDQSPEQARLRRDHVLSRMVALGMINEGQRAEAAAEPIDARWHPLPQTPDGNIRSAEADPTRAPRSTGAREQEAPDLPMAAGAMNALLTLAHQYPGKSIRTTIDASIQQACARAAQQHIQQIEPSGSTGVAVVVLDTQSAQCLAAVSIAQNNPGIDLTQSARSTGSALKPLIYAAAFDAGIANPKTILRDSPMAWPGYMPANYDRSFRGAITAAEALAESRNIPALLLLSEVGVDRAIGIMGSAGLRTLSRTGRQYGLSLAIGGAEAAPMELAEAYATLARGGVHVRSTLTFEPPTYRPVQVISPTACWRTLAAMSSFTRTSSISPDAARLNVAWKTGTSSGHRDAWCAAVTRQHTVVVWMGNPSGRGARSLIGQEAAAPLALQIISTLSTENAPWPGQIDPPGPSQLAHTPPPRRLAMLSPIDGTQVIYNSDLPADRQQVLLRAAPASRSVLAIDDQVPLWWFIDGRPIGTTIGDERLFWPPAPGRHEIRVVDAEGRFAVARISVR